MLIRPSDKVIKSKPTSGRPVGLRYITSDASQLPASSRTAAPRGRRLPAALQLLAQPLAGHVQPTLDGADRRRELARHLLQRAATQVERLQRRPVQRLETVQTLAQLRPLLGADQRLQRRLAH